MLVPEEPSHLWFPILLSMFRTSKAKYPPNDNYQAQNHGMEGQASYLPPRWNQQPNQWENNVEHSRSRRFLDVDTDSNDDSPLAPHIVNAPRPKFKTHSLERYNGQGDPGDHALNYKIAMCLQGATKSLMCLAFSTTLKGSMRD